MAIRVLLVEDERQVRESIERALDLNGYTVQTAEDGPKALDAIRAGSFDAVVLDVMLPELDGLEVCATVRNEGDAVPILMLTARDGVGDRVAGLDAGADDYLAKPFALSELLARLRAITRRNADHSGSDPRGEKLSFEDLLLDTGTHRTYRGDQRLSLTRTEYLLLELFLRHPRQVLTRSMIFERVWGYDLGVSSNALGVYVGYLRRKMEERGESRLIQTVRGVGYVLSED